MKKSGPASLILLILLLLNGTSLFAQSSQLTYTCYNNVSPVTIDGNLSDPAWRDIPWSESFSDIEGAVNPVPRHETRMKMAWDSNFLYIAARLLEPHLFATLTQRDTIIFHDPDFEVFIDPDGDSQNYYEFEINSLGTEMDLFMPKTYKEGGKYNISWNLDGIRSAVNLEGTLNNPSDIDTAWTIEIAIPWSAFTGEGHTDPAPGSGTIWRMNFSRVQWHLEIIHNPYKKVTDPTTGKPIREENWVWSPTGVINMHIPEQWGFVEFSGEPPPPRWWVWMHQGNRTKQAWDMVLCDLDTLGIRGILLSADTATLALVASKAAHYGIEVHAWIWTMNRGDAEPSWLDYNRLGKSLGEEKAYVDYYKFMNPAHPDVREFLQKKFRELTVVKGIKGVHMDYIRYVDAILPVGLQPKYNLKQNSVMPQFDYGYHPVMTNLFTEQYGLNPLEDQNHQTDSLWLAFRLDELNKTVHLLREVIQSQDLEITAAVFPTPEISRTMVMQDWNSWQLDRYFPMVYHNFYEKQVEWIKEVMAENKWLLPKTPVICGIYLPALQKGDQFSQAVSAALAGGADGVAMFDYPAFSETIRKQIMRLTHIEF